MRSQPTRRVIAPSLPGFPGAHGVPPSRRLLRVGGRGARNDRSSSGETPVDLSRSSVAGPLAAEVAGLARRSRSAPRADRTVRHLRRRRTDPPTSGRNGPVPTRSRRLLCNEPERGQQLVAEARRMTIRRVGNLSDPCDGSGRAVSVSDGQHRHREAPLSRHINRRCCVTRRRRSSHSGVVSQHRFAARLGGPVVTHTDSIGRAPRRSRPAGSNSRAQINAFLVDQRY